MARFLVMAALGASICFCSSALHSQTAQTSTATHTDTKQDAIWNELAAGNQRFVSGHERHSDYVAQRKQLVSVQHPRVAVLSCSDSRVPPEVVFDQGLGDLFVVRVAGNSADPMAIGSLEYAVEHLGTNMIVVLGHQSCGAVTAACSGEKMPSTNLDAVVAPVEESCKVAHQKSDKSGVVDFAIRDHVRRTAEDLLAKSSILKHAHDEGKLSVVEAYYSLDTGQVTKLR